MSAGAHAWKPVYYVKAGGIRGSVRGNVEGRRKRRLGATRSQDEGFPLIVEQGGANLKERIHLMGRCGWFFCEFVI